MLSCCIDYSDGLLDAVCSDGYAKGTIQSGKLDRPLWRTPLTFSIEHKFFATQSFLIKYPYNNKLRRSFLFKSILTLGVLIYF